MYLKTISHIYHIAGGKLWWVQTLRIHYKNTFGDINFGEFECL